MFGRRTVGDEHRAVSLTLSIAKSARTELQEVCYAKGIPVSRVVTKLIEAWLNDNSSRRRINANTQQV